MRDTSLVLGSPPPLTGWPPVSPVSEPACLPGCSCPPTMTTLSTCLCSQTVSHLHWCVQEPKLLTTALQLYLPLNLLSLFCLKRL